MTSFLKQLQDLAISRVKNTLFLTFVMAWATINYDFILTLLFSSINVEDKIEYIKLFPFSIDKSFLYPLGITLIYQLLLPLLNLGLSLIKEKTVNKWIMIHKNTSLKNYYESKEDVEKAKAKTENIVRKYELDIKKDEIKIEKEGIDLENFKEYQKYKTEQKYPSSESITVADLIPDTTISSLSKESKKLLKEMSLDSNGVIVYSKYIGGSAIQTNNINFIESKESREIAKWESALKELQDKELIMDEVGKGEVFKITSSGYDLADKIKSNYKSKDNKTLEKNL